MDAKTITALAYEYAKWGLSCSDTALLSSQQREAALDELAEAAEDVLTWLCKRYYIVDKAKAMDKIIDDIYTEIAKEE